MTTNKFEQKYGSWALVTGAAMGLGAEFAMQIAQQGLNIVAVDINKVALENTAQQLQQKYQIEVKTIELDLSLDNFMELLVPQIQLLDIGLLVNNAGLSNIGYFTAQSTDFLLKQLHVNTQAVLLLTHYFATKMQQQKRGGIIILSSGAGELSSAYNASYSATKAYDLKLAESLWAELKPFGVDVLGFMPGPTLTPGYKEQGGDEHGAMVMSVQVSVKQALNALGEHPSYSAGNIFMRIAHGLITRFFSTKFRINLVSQQIKKMFKV